MNIINGFYYYLTILLLVFCLCASWYYFFFLPVTSCDWYYGRECDKSHEITKHDNGGGVFSGVLLVQMCSWDLHTYRTPISKNMWSKHLSIGLVWVKFWTKLSIFLKFWLKFGNFGSNLEIMWGTSPYGIITKYPWDFIPEKNLVECQSKILLCETAIFYLI